MLEAGDIDWLLQLIRESYNRPMDTRAILTTRRLTEMRAALPDR